MFFSRIAQINKVNRLKEKTNRSTRRTLVSMVAKRQWPANGLTELRGLVDKELPWAQELISGERAPTVSESLKYSEVLFALMYVDSPQGRSSALIDMKCSQCKGEYFLFSTNLSLTSYHHCRPSYYVLLTFLTELVSKGFATSSMFKTCSKYGLQPVTAGPKSAWLLQGYWDRIRPVLAKGTVPAPTDPLFINAAGGSFVGLGRRVQSFFEKRGLVVGVTTLRGVVETSAEQALLNGEISSKQRGAVHFILGHTGQVRPLS